MTTMRGLHRGDSVERISKSPGDPWFEEHRSRYLWAAQFIRGGTVIDAACGSGFGMGELAAEGARLVLGLDLSRDDLIGQNSSQGIFVCQSDVLRLPVRDESFDVVVSFETIEHLSSAEVFLDEIARVLRPEGSLILSTPNGSLTTRRGIEGAQNPYHVREFAPEELRGLVSQRFTDVEVFGQVVSRDFGVCPFWDARSRRDRLRDLRLKDVLWSLLARFPRRTADRLAVRWLGQPLYPSAEDFDFNELDIAKAHVFVIKARRVKNRLESLGEPPRHRDPGRPVSRR